MKLTRSHPCFLSSYTHTISQVASSYMHSLSICVLLAYMHTLSQVCLILHAHPKGHSLELVVEHAIKKLSYLVVLK